MAIHNPRAAPFVSHYQDVTLGHGSFDDGFPTSLLNHQDDFQARQQYSGTVGGRETLADLEMAAEAKDKNKSLGRTVPRLS